jgi:hypothetical protein
MRGSSAAVIVLCAGCGFGLDPTNNGLEGSWTAAEPSGTARMVLVPGAESVSGTGTVTFSGTPNDHVATYAISTLPDRRLHWTLVTGAADDPTPLDFKVRIVPVCEGEPLPDPSRVYVLDLEGLLFIRDGPLPRCSRFLAPG